MHVLQLETALVNDKFAMA